MRLKLTAVTFIRHITTLAEPITDPACWNAETSVIAVELIITARYAATVTYSLQQHLESKCWCLSNPSIIISCTKIVKIAASSQLKTHKNVFAAWVPPRTSNGWEAYHTPQIP